MGKRSDFERIPQDRYDTPPKAVEPLLPHLEHQRFVEPCVGNGFLVGHLKRAGYILVGAYDLFPRRAHQALQRGAGQSAG
jgi:hypothetical protein